MTWTDVHCHWFPSLTPMSSLTQHISWQRCIKCYFFKSGGKGTCHFHFLHGRNICFLIASNQGGNLDFVLLNSWAGYAGFLPALECRGRARAKAGAFPCSPAQHQPHQCFSKHIMTWKNVFSLYEVPCPPHCKRGRGRTGLEKPAMHLQWAQLRINCLN